MHAGHLRNATGEGETCIFNLTTNTSKYRKQMENETNRFSQWPVGTLLPESAVSHTGNSGKTRTRHCHLTIPMIPAAGNTSLPLATAEGLK
jgi:hypothetical protein